MFKTGENIVNDPAMRDDCENCGTPDVPFDPGVGGELYGECPNCEASQTRYDRTYQVVDSDDRSAEGEKARESNRRSGFLW